MKLDKKVASVGISLATVLLASPAIQAKTPNSPPNDLENRVTELEATAAFLQSELDAVNEAINQLQADLTTETTTRETEVNGLDGRVTAHQLRITTNESDINANFTLIEDIANRIDGLKPMALT